MGTLIGRQIIAAIEESGMYISFHISFYDSLLGWKFVGATRI